MRKTSADDSPLSPHRAFVVQLREQADIEQDRWTGRVEHVTSGWATHFQSLQELVAFIAKILASATGALPTSELETSGAKKAPSRPPE